MLISELSTNCLVDFVIYDQVKKMQSDVKMMKHQENGVSENLNGHSRQST
jgi:hypothetical protein